MVLNNEVEAYSDVLLEHFRATARGLSRLRPEHWDWTYSPSAPTPRCIAVHALAWLQCDRQHITNPDVSSHHPVPSPPTEAAEILEAMEVEARAWEELFRSLTPEDLDRSGLQFGDPESPMNVRGFIAHMVQNVVYKHGQFATIFYALGYDGNGPYEAPYPNPLYKKFAGIE